MAILSAYYDTDFFGGNLKRQMVESIIDTFKKSVETKIVDIHKSGNNIFVFEQVVSGIQTQGEDVLYLVTVNRDQPSNAGYAWFIGARDFQSIQSQMFDSLTAQFDTRISK